MATENDDELAVLGAEPPARGPVRGWPGARGPLVEIFGAIKNGRLVSLRAWRDEETGNVTLSIGTSGDFLTLGPGETLDLADLLTVLAADRDAEEG